MCVKIIKYIKNKIYYGKAWIYANIAKKMI